MEIQRIQFMEHRDGKEKAKQFALQTLRSYRRNVLNGFAKKERNYRRKFIEHYLELKRYYLS